VSYDPSALVLIFDINRPSRSSSNVTLDFLSTGDPNIANFSWLSRDPVPVLTSNISNLSFYLGDEEDIGVVVEEVAAHLSVQADLLIDLGVTVLVNAEFTITAEMGGYIPIDTSSSSRMFLSF
jgi:hypothetical protein